MTLRALLFDLDGTLADTDRCHLRAFQEALAPYGRTLDAETYRTEISGHTNREIGTILLPDRDVSEHEFFADRKEALFRDLAATMQPVEGLRDLLAWAENRDLRLAVVTNAPRANLRHMLNALGLTGTFHVEVYGEEVERPKPDPLPYRTALARLGVGSAEAMAFEDSVPGLNSAIGAGIETIGIATTQPMQVLTRTGAALAVADFSDPRLLARLNHRIGTE